MAYERTTMAQKKAVCSTLSSECLKPIPMPFVADTQSAFSSTSGSASPKDDTQVKDKVPSSVKEEVVGLDENMQFSNMTSCTFNINLKM